MQLDLLLMYLQQVAAAPAAAACVKLLQAAACCAGRLLLQQQHLGCCNHALGGCSASEPRSACHQLMEQHLLLFLRLQLVHQALLLPAVAALLCRWQQAVQVAVCHLQLQSEHG